MTDSSTPPLPTYLFVEWLRVKSKSFWLLPAIATYYFIYCVLTPYCISTFLSFLMSSDLSSTLVLICAVMTSHHIAYFLHCSVLRGISQFKLWEQYRCNPAAEWPWNNEPQLVFRTYRTLALNFFILIPLTLFLGDKAGLFAFTYQSTLPSVQEILGQFIFSMCAEDVWSYTFHRLNHLKQPYRLIHKKHHEYKTSIGMAAEYAHPIEFLITNVIAAAVGPTILGKRMHMVTFITWLCYRIGDTVDQHGGYEFPWSPFSILPFASKRYSATADFHDFHHSHNVGNYGSQFSLLDWLCGTSPYYYQHMLKKYGEREKSS